MKRFAAFSLLVFFAIAGSRVSAETKSHAHETTHSMKEQHHSMSTINKQWNAFRRAMKSGDLKTANAAVEKISAAAAYLENFKLHRNADKHDRFIEYGNAFKSKLLSLRNAIAANNLEAVRELSKGVQHSCDQCHQLFR